MTFEEIYKYCSEYPGLNCKHEDDGEIIVYDSIFNNGWDYFMTTDEDKVGFYPIVYEMETKFFCTSNFIKSSATYENTAFEQKGDEVVGLTQEKLKEYLDRLSKDIKKTKQKIRKNAIKEDFVK